MHIVVFGCAFVAAAVAAVAAVVVAVVAVVVVGEVSQLVLYCLEIGDYCISDCVRNNMVCCGPLLQN